MKLRSLAFPLLVLACGGPIEPPALPLDVTFRVTDMQLSQYLVGGRRRCEMTVTFQATRPDVTVDYRLWARSTSGNGRQLEVAGSFQDRETVFIDPAISYGSPDEVYLGWTAGGPSDWERDGHWSTGRCGD